MKFIISAALSIFLFSQLSFAANTPQLNLMNNTLRVCTTGDYPPLTNLVNGQFQGKAISNAKSIAKYLGVKVKFIKTTWATLSHDLLANKCDIAMGGISATPERAKAFLMTAPVATFGKVPLVRCKDVNKYNTLEKINQPQVRVVENMGGTNYLFAKRYLTKAKLVMVKKNKTTFQYLLHNKADVMITDNIEARYRHKIMPKLCAVNPDQPFTKNYKVYLISKSHPELLKQINQWIKRH